MDSGVVYEFGAFRLDERQHQLFNGDAVVPLPPKVFDTLLALVKRHGEVVSRQDLVEQIWPGAFVEEGGLSRNISVLRKALAGNDDDQEFIETIPKRGYKFVAPVRIAGPVPAAAPVLAPLETPLPQGRRRVWIGAAIVLALATATAWTWLRPREPAAISGRLVVLPFENLTRQEADDWLSGALSDSLTYGLRNITSVTLVNRERITEIYNEEQVKEAVPVSQPIINQLSRRFAVHHYVHGTYQRIGDEIRVVARLVATGSGEIRAQESVTDRFENILDLQDRLANRLAEALTTGGTGAIRVSTTRSLEAYRAHADALSSYYRADHDQAQRQLGRAVALDPAYAEAWALLSKSHARSVSGINSVGRDEATNHATALAAAERALAIDPKLHDGHVAMALVHRLVGNVSAWREAAKTAIELNANDAEAYGLLADSYGAGPTYACVRNRDPELAETYYQKAIAIDPLYTTLHGNRASNHFFAGRLESSLAAVEEGLRYLPQSQGLLARKVTRLAWLERPVDPALRAQLKGTGYLTILAGAMAHLQRPETAVEGWAALDQLDVLLEQMASPDPDISVAYVYLKHGKTARAIARLEHAERVEQGCARFITDAGLFAPFRNLPEITAFLARHR